MFNTFFDMMEASNYVVLDTETTGLDRPAEIIQIAIVDCKGEILFDTLIKPKLFIPAAATAIHQITNELVKDSPTWPDIKPAIVEALQGKDVITYNAVFDRKMMHWSDELWELGRTDYHQGASWYCAMELFAEYHGERHPYYGSYVWKSLSYARESLGITSLGDHDALSDAMTTFILINRLYALVRGKPI